MTQQNQDEVILPKLSELRARETKARKTEEQLKIKEKSLNQMLNDKVTLETRCQQLEARNFELEQTVKLLRRRIESDDKLNMPNATESHDPTVGSQDKYSKMKEQLDAKLVNLHTKLSNIVLDEMDRQIDKIKLFDDTPQIKDETSSASRSVPVENLSVNSEKENNLAKTAQQLTGQPLHYKPASYTNVPNRIPPMYMPNPLGGTKTIGYHSAHQQRQRAHRQTYYEAHTRTQATVPRNVMHTPMPHQVPRNVTYTPMPHQPFLVQQSLGINRM